MPRSRTTARARRRSRFRTTAEPQRRPIAYADLGKHAGGGLVGRGEDGTHRTAGAAGTGALQLGEGGAAGDPSDRPSRHESPPSDGEAVAPLEPP